MQVHRSGAMGVDERLAVERGYVDNLSAAVAATASTKRRRQDPVFRPEGLHGASALLTADEKNAISHRARAFGALVEVLRARYG